MTGQLSRISAALVIARRDFTAILCSRSFLFFLLGPLFPVVVAVMAGGIGQHVNESKTRPVMGIAMSTPDAETMLAARAALASRLGDHLPELVIIATVEPNETFDAPQALAQGPGNVAALVSGSLTAPQLTGTEDWIERWRGPVSMLAAQALGNGPASYPEVTVLATASSTAGERRGRLTTAQAGQTLLFLLTMLLAGMVLSNLVEEKGNKIIEVLAAAVPMDSVFLGKLFAMLAVSMVGVAVWGTIGGSLFLLAGQALPDMAEPAVGWPLFLGLGVLYFAMAYLLLGSVFLAIGSMAATVREVQTLSMPVTMMQLMVFFLASYAMTQPGSAIELVSATFPFSSPFAMVARAAQDGALWPHGLALLWQVICVTILVRAGARLFRNRVMKSGSGGSHRASRGPLARLRRAPA